MTARPPALALWLLVRLLDRDSYEAVAGDLDEEFLRVHESHGRGAAARGYWSAAIRSIVVCRITGERRVERRRMDFDGGARASLRDLLKPALRQFRDHPVYAVATAGTLALAIGIGAVTMTVVKRAYLDPLPYRDDARLHSLLTSVGGNTSAVSPFVLQDLRGSQSPFVEFAGIRPIGFAYAAASFTESIAGSHVASEYFSLLGVTPALGRIWTPDERDAIVISWTFWNMSLQGDPNVIARSIVLDGRPRTIVGVMPESFVPPYFAATAVWAPLDMAPLMKEPRARRTLTVLVRRAAHTTVDDVKAFLAIFSTNQQQQDPGVLGNVTWVAPLLRDELVGTARPAVIGAGAAALILLLIVAANIAGLSAAHAAATRQQVAIRSALGATRSRLFAEQLVETLVLTLLGSMIGVWIAYALTELVVQYQQQFLPRLAAIRLDWATVAGALATGVLIGAFASVLPRRVLGAQPSDALRTSRGGSIDRRLARTRSSLVMAQVALALVLLVGAGLLIRTVQHLSTMNLGFNPDNLFVISMNLPVPRYQSNEVQVAFEREVLDRVSRIHGVEAATASVGVPVIGGMMAGLAIKGEPAGTAQREIAYLSVAPDFLSAIGATIVEGRGLLATDIRSAPRVVVINETMARMFWPNGDAVGSQVFIGAGAPSEWITIVGIYGDIRTHGPTEVIRPAAFGSTLQYSWPRRHITVRASENLPPALRPSCARRFMGSIQRFPPAPSSSSIG
jgi:predicted permease